MPASKKSKFLTISLFSSLTLLLILSPVFIHSFSSLITMTSLPYDGSQVSLALATHFPAFCFQCLTRNTSSTNSSSILNLWDLQFFSNNFPNFPISSEYHYSFIFPIYRNRSDHLRFFSMIEKVCTVPRPLLLPLIIFHNGILFGSPTLIHLFPSSWAHSCLHFQLCMDQWPSLCQWDMSRRENVQLSPHLFKRCLPEFTHFLFVSTGYKA